MLDNTSSDYTNSPDRLLEEIRNDMSAVVEHLDNGGVSDLVDIDKKVRYFCELITTLPAVDAKKYQENLSEFIEELNKIANKLMQQKENVQCKIDELSQRQMAQNAYSAALNNQS